MSPATRLRTFYFLYYGSVGATLPFFAAYLRGLGFTGEQIGTVQMLGPIVAAPVALTWATAADRIGAPSRAAALASLWCLAATLFLPFARTPITFGAVVLAQALADRAIIPLIDAVSLEWSRVNRRPTYVGIRLFGSFGYIVVSLGLGLLLALRGDRPGDVLVPLSALLCVAGYALTARGLPSAPVDSARPRARDTYDLARDPRLLALLFACAVHWAASGPFHLMFGVFVRDSGLPAGITGLAMGLGSAAEILALLAFPLIERRFRLASIFAFVFAATTLRWALLYRAQGAAAFVLIQLLHAISFGVFWGASMKALTLFVPSALRATGQALYSSIVFGIGNAVGYQLAGIGYDRYGGVRPLFAWSTAIEGILFAGTMALIWLAGRQSGAAEPSK